MTNEARKWSMFTEVVMIYFIQADGIGHIKIGFTDGETADARLATLQTGSPVPLRLLHTIPGTLEDEKALHRRFAAAGVGGEWFKAVPDLLAMIPARDLRACGPVEVAERSVTIRTLTVGRKQFGKTMFWQLPVGVCFYWQPLIDRLLESFAPGGEFRYTPDEFRDCCDPRADRWGWVEVNRRWVIFERGGRLYRHDDSDTDFRILAHESIKAAAKGRVISSFDDSFRDGWPHGVPDRFRQPLHTLFESRKRQPGWRDKDQLFFGV